MTQEITKEWCLKMAQNETNTEIGDGLLAVDPFFRCPRPINAAENESAEWCKKNGHCGCVDIDELRKEYGELLYPVTRWTDETQVD